MESIKYTTEYQLIKQFYGGRTAKRSGVELMNHIDEGVFVLSRIHACSDVKRAFCLHPLFQNDEDFAKNYGIINRMSIDPYVVMLTIEYRNIANQYLSHRKIDSLEEISLSPMEEVNEMLIADKIQNYKDFLIYHDGVHPRSNELNEYFNNWLKRLDVHHKFEDERQAIVRHFNQDYTL
jgi:hypothetical protein